MTRYDNSFEQLIVIKVRVLSLFEKFDFILRLWLLQFFFDIALYLFVEGGHKLLYLFLDWVLDDRVNFEEVEMIISENASIL